MFFYGWMNYEYVKNILLFALNETNIERALNAQGCMQNTYVRGLERL